MNDCADKGQQQFTTQTDRQTDIRKSLVGKHERKKHAGRIRYGVKEWIGLSWLRIKPHWRALVNMV
jgi:hypothetical protein